MKTLINYILFFLLVGLFFNSDFFERTFFLNELFSFLGFLIIITNILKNNTLKIKLESFDFFIFLFLLICLFHLAISIPKKTNWYFYARNSVIFYSVFGYFFGKYYFLFFERTINKLTNVFKLFIFYAIAIQKTILARYSGVLLFPALFKKINLKILLTLIILILIHGLIHDALSIVILAFLLFTFWIIPNFRTLKVVTFLLFIGIILFYSYFHDYILLYKDGGYAYFGSVLKVINSHPILSLDHNTTWRVILWYRFIVERFPENILGIGFGTPLLFYKPEIRTASMVIDEVHAHVSGAHNTFITLFVRLGIFGVYLLYRICVKIFKGFYRLKQMNSNSPLLKYYFIWFSIFSLALFNLCLESPLRAGIFWICVGFISKLESLNKLC